jgi:alpha-1,6-mannosyltransferase
LNPKGKQFLKYLLVLLMAGLLFILAQIPRTEFALTFFIFSLLFAGMGLAFLITGEKTNWKVVFVAGILFRLAVFGFGPQWSDDVYRFLWDGELLKMGENPYLQTPGKWQEENQNSDDAYLNHLFQNLNSPDYYSVYPPLNQAVFWIGAKASMGFAWNGFMGLRLILLLGEIGVFFLLLRILRTFQKPENLLILYWFNPLVILEITGNFHFEGLVLLFLLASIDRFTANKMTFSGGFWGLAIGMKLLPLIFAPSFFFSSQTRKDLAFWSGVSVAVILSFVWLWVDQSYVNFFQSLRLYQEKFEFNASLYYLFREVGFWIQGYNIIETLTKILSLATLIGIVFFSWKRRPNSTLELLDLWVLIYLIYLIFQPIIHPWYIIPALGLSLFTKKNAFLIWSFAVIFSYQAYGNVDFKENSIFLFLEYFLVYAAIYLDYFRPKRKLNLIQ